MSRLHALWQAQGNAQSRNERAARWAQWVAEAAGSGPRDERDDAAPSHRVHLGRPDHPRSLLRVAGAEGFRFGDGCPVGKWERLETALLRREQLGRSSNWLISGTFGGKQRLAVGDEAGSAATGEVPELGGVAESARRW